MTTTGSKGTPKKTNKKKTIKKTSKKHKGSKRARDEDVLAKATDRQSMADLDGNNFEPGLKVGKITNDTPVGTVFVLPEPEGEVELASRAGSRDYLHLLFDDGELAFETLTNSEWNDQWAPKVLEVRPPATVESKSDKRLAAIEKAGRRCTNSLAVVESIKVDLKAAKGEHDKDCLALFALVNPPNMPLYDQKTNDAPAVAPSDDSWREWKLDQLTGPELAPKILAKLAANEPSLTTLGELEDWKKKKGMFWATDIPGIGVAAQGKIDDFTYDHVPPGDAPAPEAAATAGAPTSLPADDPDEYFDRAREILDEVGDSAKVSVLQRKLKIGFCRASKLFDAVVDARTISENSAAILLIAEGDEKYALDAILKCESLVVLDHCQALSTPDSWPNIVNDWRNAHITARIEELLDCRDGVKGDVESMRAQCHRYVVTGKQDVAITHIRACEDVYRLRRAQYQGLKGDWRRSAVDTRIEELLAKK